LASLAFAGAGVALPWVGRGGGDVGTVEMVAIQAWSASSMWPNQDNMLHLRASITVARSVGVEEDILG